MSKKRTKSQKTGEIGEAIFREFALKNNLLPNKSEYDYGIDFICQQVSENVCISDTIGHSYLCVNVKSSKARRPRAKLNIDDLEVAILAEFPLLFILVDTLNSHLYYKFLDLSLLEEFNDTFNKKSSYVITPNKMAKGRNQDSEFQKETDLYLRRENQDRIWLRKIELKISNKIGDAKLKIIQEKSGNLAIIKTSKIENFYSSGSQSFSIARDTYLNYNFKDGAWLPTDVLDKDFLSDVGTVASKIIMMAPTIGGARVISIRDKRTKKKTKIEFEVRKFHDETSFYHPTGLSIVFSEARKNEKDGLYYHHNDILYKDPNAAPLFSHPKMINFLKACKENAELCLSEDAQSGIKVSHWPELIRLRKVILGLELIYRNLQINKPAVKLPDINIKKYQYSFGLLEHIFRNKNKEKDVLPGFVFTGQEVDLIWEKALINCPLIVALPEGTIKLKIESIGKMAFRVDESFEKRNPVGARFDRLASFHIEKTEDQIDYGEYPILPINGTMAIEFGEKGPSQIKSPVDERIRLEVEG
jgi:hypothetical protein